MDVVAILGLGVKISIFMTVLSLGMRASLSDIAHLFRRPGQLIKALLAIFVIMPVFAILVVKNFALSPVVGVVLLALSVSPIPPMFPKKAFKSGGEAPFTFGLLAAVTLLSTLMIPLAFEVFDVFPARHAVFASIPYNNTRDSGASSHGDRNGASLLGTAIFRTSCGPPHEDRRHPAARLIFTDPGRRPADDLVPHRDG